MELTHLHTFVTVAEEKSLTRAAKRLYTTPSAVSMQIKALEDELNIQLFLRTSRGVELTEQGGQLRAKADQTLQAANALLNCARDMQAHLTGRAAIGLNAAPRFLRVPALIAALRAKHPAVDLHVVPSMSGTVLAALRQGHLDVGFVFGTIADPVLTAHPLHVAELVVAAPRSWQRRLERAGWAELARLPWIYSDSYCPFQDLIDGVFATHGLHYERLVQSDDEMTKAELVAAGVGLTLLEKGEALNFSERVMIYDAPPLPCALSLVYLKHRQHEPLIKALAQQITAIWA
jgi:DNA-binding transcriptional LysR family regulator